MCQRWAASDTGSGDCDPEACARCQARRSARRRWWWSTIPLRGWIRARAWWPAWRFVQSVPTHILQAYNRKHDVASVSRPKCVEQPMGMSGGVDDANGASRLRRPQFRRRWQCAARQLSWWWRGFFGRISAFIPRLPLRVKIRSCMHDASPSTPDGSRHRMTCFMSQFFDDLFPTCRGGGGTYGGGGGGHDRFPGAAVGSAVSETCHRRMVCFVSTVGPRHDDAECIPLRRRWSRGPGLVAEKALVS